VDAAGANKRRSRSGRANISTTESSRIIEGSNAASGPMLGFKTQKTADFILSGIELVHMMRKRQARFAYNPAPTLAEQFDGGCHVV
jgi:transposase-like protein